ncbi:MAG: type II secretion system F family protein [Clostridia bacterium]|nr:type II secretion system F family protein [Clostridia bacterium]
MPVFVYKAVTKNGVIVKNRVDDINKFALIQKLKRNDLTPIDIVQAKQTVKKQKIKRKNIKADETVIRNLELLSSSKATAASKFTFKEKMDIMLSTTEKITTRDIIIFTENFLLLKKANFNNIHALNTIIGSTENLMLREIIEDILAGLEQGENMYTTMEYYSHIFPYIYINMIKVGELSGSLTNSLEQALRYMEETSSLTKKLKKILIPNIIQFVSILAMLILGGLFAIPAMQGVFDSIGTEAELPKITVWFADFLDDLIAHWYIPVLVIVGIVGSIVAYISTPKGKYNWHLFKYKAPVFGKLVYSLDFTRIMRAMLLNLQNGMRIQDALEVGKNVCNNYVMLATVEAAINNLLSGRSWIEPFENSGLASSMMIEMLKIGMQTDLSEMMEKLLELMDMDINNILDKIMKTLPQIVYSIVGVVLIFFVIVVLVPVIQLYMGNFMFSAYGF